MIPVTAIFDIGKTNKKLLLFDNGGKVVFSKQEILPETTDEDGEPCEDIELLKGWILNNWEAVMKHKDFQIRAVNFTSYGASFVHLDCNNKIITPVYNYLKKFPEELEKQFYKTYGEKFGFSADTASPPLGMLNSGLQLYWLKYRKKELFSKIETALHLPQFLSFLISNLKISEYTSIGCHTAMWDFEKHSYHEWIKKEKIDAILPPIYKRPVIAFKRVGRRLLNVGTGLHDSSASLIPYIKTFKEPFLLLSTGTWCVTLNPFDHSPLTQQDLENDCLNFLTNKGASVKASRFFLGKEHDHYTERIAFHFNKNVDYCKDIAFDKNIVESLILRSENNSTYPKFIPSYLSGVSKVDKNDAKNTDLSEFNSFEEAYHQLLLDLCSILKQSIKFIDKNNSKILFVEGGFAKNTIFMNMLSNHFPSKEVIAADLAQATAFGAYLYVNNKNKVIDWQLIRYNDSGLENLFENYQDKFYSSEIYKH
jgi:L-fuculokinase